MYWDIVFRLTFRWRRAATCVGEVTKRLTATSAENTNSVKFFEPTTSYDYSYIIAENLKAGNFPVARKFMDTAVSKGFHVSKSLTFRVYAGCAELRKAFMTFRQAPLSKALLRHLGNTAIQSLDQFGARSNSSKLLVLAAGGPGDEIYFASYYKQLLDHVSRMASITCDPRLFSLMQRAFPNVEIIPVNRLHRLWDDGNYKKLKSARLLPTLSLYRVFDDTLWLNKSNYRNVITIFDALGDLVEKKHPADGKPYLRADPVLVGQWKGRLDGISKKSLIGLSWRSTFLNKKRNVHYLEVNQLTPFLEQSECTFVILQAKMTGAEKAWLAKGFSDRLIFLDDLDMFNDFENLSAVLSNLSMIISPGTYLAELAGALGTKCLLLSNSTENFYRRHPQTKQDFRYACRTHCEGLSIGDKAGLIENAAARLKSHHEKEHETIKL
jgi:hypothetical protein